MPSINVDNTVSITVSGMYEGGDYNIAFEKYEDAGGTIASEYEGTFHGYLLKSPTSTTPIKGLTDGDGLIITANSVAIDPALIKTLKAKMYFVKLYLNSNLFFKVILNINK